MNVNDAARVGELEKENARLKRLLAERNLEVDIIKGLLQIKELLQKKVAAADGADGA